MWNFPHIKISREETKILGKRWKKFPLENPYHNQRFENKYSNGFGKKRWDEMREKRKKLGKNLSKWKLPHDSWESENRQQKKLLRSLCSLLNVIHVAKKILSIMRLEFFVKKKYKLFFPHGGCNIWKVFQVKKKFFNKQNLPQKLRTEFVANCNSWQRINKFYFMCRWLN